MLFLDCECSCGTVMGSSHDVNGIRILCLVLCEILDPLAIRELEGRRGQFADSI